MARRSLAPLLVALPLVAAAVVVALWLLLGGEGEAPALPGAVGPAPAAADDAPVAAADLESPDEPPEPAAPRAAARVETTSADGVEASFDLRGARWVEGRVVVPAGAPADDTLTVVALGENRARIDEHGMFAIELGANGQRSWQQREELARAPVAADGSFRLPFRPGPEGDGSTEAALVDVDGRYLYLDEPRRLDLGTLGDEEVVLEPELGGALRVELVLPRGSDEVPGTTEVATFAMTGGGDGSVRTLRLEDATVGELRAVPAGPRRIVTVQPDIYPAAMGPEQVVVEAGGDPVMRIELQLGARVRGRVVDAGGAPVEGAQVRASAQAFDFLGRGGRSAETDAEGRFDVRGLGAGKVQLQVAASGRPRGQSDELELTDGQVLDDLEIALPAGLPLAGVVRWPDGRPAEGARVRALPREDRQSWLFRDLEDARDEPVVTDAEGRFRFEGLEDVPFALFAEGTPPGAAEAHADAKDGADAPPAWTARVDSVAAGAEDLVLELRAPLALGGRVEDDTGAPVDAFTVVAKRPDWPGPNAAEHKQVQRTFTGAGGRFLLEGPDAGTWTVTVQAKGHLTTEPREVVLPTGELEPFVLTRTARLTGTVLDPAGQPVEGAEVTVRGRDRGRTARAKTDAAGRFAAEPAGPGAVTVVARSDDWAPSADLELDLLPGEERTDVVLSLTVGGAIAGVLYDRTGAPEAGSTVMLQSSGRTGGREARTDAGGRFRVEHLEPGAYQVMAMPDPSRWMVSGEQPDMGELFEQLRMTTATVVEGETTEVVLGAPPRAPVVVHGRITRGGEPAARANVMVMHEGGALLERMRADTADENGFYEVRLDEPGDYTFVVMRQMGGSNGIDFPVTIPEVERHEFDLELPGGSLAGVVVGPDGGPPESAYVWLRRQDTSAELAGLFGQSSIAVSEDGTFRADELRPGRYAVTATAGDVAATTLHDVVVGDGPTEGLELRLSAGGRVTGRVVEETGEPVEGAVVFVRDAAGRPLPRLEARTDARGEFTVHRVPAGDVTVSARTLNYATPTSAPLRVPVDGDAHVELVAVEGTVLRILLEDEDGQVVRAAIRVEDEDGRDHAGLTSDAELERVVTEGFSTTERRVGPLAPGRYTVSAQAPDGRDARKSVTLRGQDDRKVRLRLRD